MGKDLIEIYGHTPSDLSGEYVADEVVKVVYGFRYCFEHLRRWREYTLKAAKAARDVGWFKGRGVDRCSS